MLILVISFVIILEVTVVHGCPTGWKLNGQTCYHFSSDKQTYMNAKAVCEYLGGWIVEINSEKMNNYIHSQVKLHSKVFWIGLNDLEVEGTWIWTQSRNPVNFTNWVKGTPNNGENNENCGIINPLGTWNDIPCTAAIDYICERPYLNCTGNRRYDAVGTGYYPNSGNGGHVDMRRQPLHTLQDYLDGKTDIVTVGMDDKAGIDYDTHVCIPELNHEYGRFIDFRVRDTDGDVFYRAYTRINICTRTRKNSYERTINGPLTLVFI